MALSPMMQQYMGIKDENRDSILFFRLGDFYEMFFEDAITVSKELELTLTGKNCGLDERAPMCGVPYHSCDSYIARLIEKGYKVAICEQMEDPSTTKGLVRRAVTRIITPGTVTNESILKEDENNYLASIYAHEDGFGFSFCDISTGEVQGTELMGLSSSETLLNELARINPKEVLINCDGLAYCTREEVEGVSTGFITELNGNFYNSKSSMDRIRMQFDGKSDIALGLDGNLLLAKALGAQLLYLQETQKQSMDHLIDLKVYSVGNHMALDKSTIRNLELTETLFERKVEGTLLWILKKTHTAMGSRKLKQWLREPLNDVNEIVARLNGVELLIDEPLMRNNMKESLKSVYDFERLSSRISCGHANGRDLIALRNSIYVLPDLKMDLMSMNQEILQDLGKEMDTMADLFAVIDGGISEEPPFTLREGGLIKEGYSEELDELKDSIKDAKLWIANLESVEKDRTGIPNLKVGYNRVFGYYIEVTKSKYHMVPDNYIRKQTLVNAERFITPELKDMEGLVLNAESKINKLEYDIFNQVREYVKKFIPSIQKTSRAISELDVLLSFAQVSSDEGYVKPNINDGDEINIEKGRHPVIERTLGDGTFVSNDTHINKSDTSLLLITGPNMAGKSTYMRQTAIIVLMAQIGCFVPASKATIGVVDRIFTRIGAFDNLAGGQSTFFVEMSELSFILNNATKNSLVILDEIGRGTSTYDGLSIAWALCEHICRKNHQVRTMFASHYHELTSLENELPGLKNLSVDVTEENGDIVFLHKIINGSSPGSYGIQVAKLAGIPKSILERANEKLGTLEENSVNNMKDEFQLEFKI